MVTAGATIRDNGRVQSVPSSTTGRVGAGFSTHSPLQLTGADGRGATVPNTGCDGHVVAAGDELHWIVLPEGTDDVATRWDATCVAVDLEFTDGTRLSGLDVADQYGGAITPDAQGAAKRLWPDQWNLRRVDLAPALGRTVARVIATLACPSGRPVRAFLDSVEIVQRPERTSSLDHVLTTRGTHSTRAFSRGNNAPLVALPHGGVFGVPMTDASAADWPYSYASHHRDDDRPAIQAFATSHIASPWMRDHGVVQVMPAASIAPDVDRSARALGFDRATEQDGPHRYAVTLDGGIAAELTAGAFAVGMRFEFSGSEGSIVFDHLGHGTLTRSAAVDDGWVVEATLRPDGPKPGYFMHLHASRIVSANLAESGERITGYLVAESGPVTVDIVIGLSTVSTEQAALNARRAGTFDDQLAAATAAWEQALAVLTVDGCSEDQRISLYSGLYRALLYPNRYAEEGEDGTLSSGSPYERGRVIHGPFSSNNGFWDTYRTVWPLLALLDPAAAAEHANGFVAHFTEAGWSPRWSAPAAEDCMTGTTFDLVFADLVARGVPGLDEFEGYRAALKNATVPSPSIEVGRNGLASARFRGWVSTDIHEGLSWTLDNALNDAALATLARRMATLATSPADADDRAAEAEYLARRAQWYRNVFDHDRGFFIGRDAAGIRREPFDPLDWGTDYTETHAWGTAFTVPHDGAGLAELHGGEVALGRKLDELLRIRETVAPTQVGHYGTVIHEMVEARDTRMGLLALSNQPAHHIPYMYLFAGRHDDAHALVRESLDRLFVGSDFGQGYPGDEDNGEMSAWYLFGTIGLYPLVPGSGTFVLTPPAVRRTVLRPQGRPEIEIVVASGEPGFRHVAGVRVDGEPWHAISIEHAVLAGGCTIEFDLAEHPTDWAADSRPPSAPQFLGFASPLQDVAVAAGSSASIPGHERLLDDAGDHVLSLAAGDWITVPLTQPTPVSLVSLTLDAPQRVDFRVELLDAEGHPVASRDYADREFEWMSQTRVFRAPGEGTTVAHAVRLTLGGTAARARQVEVFATDPTARIGDD